MKKAMKFVAMPIILAALAACGGGDGGSPECLDASCNKPDPIDPEKPTSPGGDQKIPPASGHAYLQFSQTDAETSDLGGVAIHTNTSTRDTTQVDVTGSFNHTTAALVLTNGTYEFRAMGGEISGGEYVDDAKTGITTLLNTDTVRADGFAHLIDMTFVQDGVSYSTLGIIGMPTLAANMPTQGSVNFTGRVLGTALTTAQGVDIIDGSSLIAVEFGTSGTVDVTLDNFKFQDQATGTVASGPFDKIVVTDMTLSDSEFSQGIVTVTQSGANVDLTGANSTTASNGMLFGYDDDTGNPAQAGGALLLQGDDGFLAATYLGD